MVQGRFWYPSSKDEKRIRNSQTSSAERSFNDKQLILAGIDYMSWEVGQKPSEGNRKSERRAKHYETSHLSLAPIGVDSTKTNARVMCPF